MRYRQSIKVAGGLLRYAGMFYPELYHEDAEDLETLQNMCRKRGWKCSTVAEFFRDGSGRIHFYVDEKSGYWAWRKRKMARRVCRKPGQPLKKAR